MLFHRHRFALAPRPLRAVDGALERGEGFALGGAGVAHDTSGVADDVAESCGARPRGYRGDLSGTGQRSGQMLR